MRRASVPGALALVLALALAACGSGGRRTGRLPENALLVTVGGLRADRMNAYLYERPTTHAPATREERELGVDLSLDALAAQGVTFAYAFAPSGSTAASLASLHTGEHPLETCVLGAADDVPADVPLLAERFRSAGFRAAAFAAGVALEPERGLGRGFELAPAPVTDEEALAAARAWVAGLGAGERFFLWLHLSGPVPSAAGAEDVDAAYDEALARTAARLRGFFRWLAGADGSPVRRLSSTAVVLTAPHGMELGGRGYVGHEGSLHDAGLRVPLVLRHPASLTGRRVLDGVVSTERVAATLADWLGVPPLPGESSLLRRIDAPAPPGPGAGAGAGAVACRGDRGLSLRTADRRLVCDVEVPEEGGEPVVGVRLYDTVRDPRERIDLAPARPEETRELFALLLSATDALGTGCLAPGTLDALLRLTMP